MMYMNSSLLKPVLFLTNLFMFKHISSELEKIGSRSLILHLVDNKMKAQSFGDLPIHTQPCPSLNALSLHYTPSASVDKQMCVSQMTA